jgi:D-ribose pyranase
MKKSGILHRDLARTIAAMGHTDLLVIADAGLPVPPGVRCIDLAVVGGVPPMLEVLRAVAAELQVERLTLAAELKERGRSGMIDQIAFVFPGVPIDWLPHEDFKALTARARAVVRTGEFSPYANVILHAGVVF